jgi:hypothetical protein
MHLSTIQVCTDSVFHLIGPPRAFSPPGTCGFRKHGVPMPPPCVGSGAGAGRVATSGPVSDGRLHGTGHCAHHGPPGARSRWCTVRRSLLALPPLREAVPRPVCRRWSLRHRQASCHHVDGRGVHRVRLTHGSCSQGVRACVGRVCRPGGSRTAALHRAPPPSRRSPQRSKPPGFPQKKAPADLLRTTEKVQERRTARQKGLTQPVIPLMLRGTMRTPPRGRVGWRG